MKNQLTGWWCFVLCLCAPGLTIAQPADSTFGATNRVLRRGPTTSMLPTASGLLLTNWSGRNATVSHIDTAGVEHWTQPYVNLRAITTAGKQVALVQEDAEGMLAVSVINPDNGGRLIWRAEVGEGKQADVALLPDRSVVVVARTADGLTLSNISPKGRAGWSDELTLPDPEPGGHLGLLPLPGGGVVLTVGGTVIGVDKAGNKRWSFNAGNDKVRWNRMRLLRNGQVALVGQGTAEAFSPDNLDGRLMVIDPQTGKQAWTKILSDAPTKEAGIDVLEKTDQTLVVLLQESGGASLLHLNAQHEIRPVVRLVQPAAGQYLGLLPQPAGQYGAVFASASQTVLQNSANKPAPVPRRTTTTDTGRVNLYGLSIGVTLPLLKYTVADAASLAKAFGNAGGKVSFEVLNTPERTTAEQIATAVERLGNTLKSKPTDWIVLFVSGMLLDHPNDLRLAGSNYDPAAPRNTSISLRRLVRELSELPGRKLVLLDACIAYKPKSLLDSPPLPVSKASVFSPKQFPDTFILAASQPGELAYEDAAWQHGAFTHALLSGLAGAADTNKDAQLQLSELFAYLSETVPTLVRTQKQKEQQPTWLLRPGDAVLLNR